MSWRKLSASSTGNSKLSAKMSLTQQFEVSSSDSDSPDDTFKARCSNKIQYGHLATASREKTNLVDTYHNADSVVTDTMANDSVIEAMNEGDLSLPIDIPPITSLHVPEISENLLSIGQLVDVGVMSVFTKSGVH
ncbi:hypothetical protein CROQUDRAFT_135680 [Cronartium quercuum f. sp. fusiforme G11]|uniref:Uncharacterized protein n=1 Tax=Cronartium quercuum f. sp. fusiforme G11 TaxID=708437 RepID=A0A9P6NEJ8_9BASI|nr:hypothetical protein CROQUDRAFT_135680 [Cronartium quercuum f. sp. fusiforme G11]